MTEKEIQLLGFEKETYFGEEGDEYYYSYEITNGLSFISSGNKDIGKDGEWDVYVFNTKDIIVFKKFEELQSLINTLEKHLIRI